MAYPMMVNSILPSLPPSGSLVWLCLHHPFSLHCSSSSSSKLLITSSSASSSSSAAPSSAPSSASAPSASASASASAAASLVAKPTVGMAHCWRFWIASGTGKSGSKCQVSFGMCEAGIEALKRL